MKGCLCVGGDDTISLIMKQALQYFLYFKEPNLCSVRACWLGIVGVIQEVDGHAQLLVPCQCHTNTRLIEMY